MSPSPHLSHSATHCNRALQHTATEHCNTLQQSTATHCMSPSPHLSMRHVIRCNTLQHSTATQHCNTILQHTTINCNTLRHTRCNTALQHSTATHRRGVSRILCCSALLQCFAACCSVLQRIIAVLWRERQHYNRRETNTLQQKRDKHITTEERHICEGASGILCCSALL